MPVDYDLEINSRMTANEVAKVITQACNFQSSGKTGFFTNGLVGSVKEMSKSGQEVIQEYFGFTPTLRVNFSADQSAQPEIYEKAMRDGLKAFMTVLQYDDGDAISLMEGESIIFTRISGKLILGSSHFSKEDGLIWNYKDIPFPFETKEFEILN